MIRGSQSVVAPPATLGEASMTTGVCLHCLSMAGAWSNEPSSARCPVCGGPLPLENSDLPRVEDRGIGEGLGDLGLSLADGSSICPVAFGPYRVLGLIGKGGMGLVYRARHEVTGVEVAIKTVRVRQRGMLHRIRREIHALARIEHPGLVRIIETGQSDGLPWYAMELLQGQSLQERLQETGQKLAVTARNERLNRTGDDETRADFILALSRDPVEVELGSLAIAATVTIGFNNPPIDRDRATLDDVKAESTAMKTEELPGLSGEVSLEDSPPSDPSPTVFDCVDKLVDERAPPELIEDEARRDFLVLIARLCESLAYLHSEGIVHRDIKPQNVIIRPDGSPVLLDFGLASYFGAEGRESLEVGGKVEGTPEYMSPEQIRGEYVDARADLYAVGCILYEGLTGTVPFKEPTPGKVLKAHVRCPPIPPRDLRPDIPQLLNDLILQLLAKKAGERLGYARDILATLAKLGCGSTGWPTARHSRDYLYRPGFVGRDSTLKALEKHVRRVLGRPGHCIFLRGRSGVGKTRFIMEVARQFEQAGTTVVTGECLPIGVNGVEGDEGPKIRATPLHPFRSFLQMVADYCLEGGTETVSRLLGQDGGILVECEPSLASLPGLAKAPPCSDDDAEGSLQSRLIEALGLTLEEFARTSPVVLFLDDLQWADALTLHFLALFHVGVWDSPNVAIVASFRSEETDSAIKGYLPVFQDATFVDLGPLEEPSLGAIVRDMLGSNRADDRFVRHLARKSNGNPFFVAEYLRAAVAEGLLSRDDSGCWRPKVDHSGLDSEALEASIPLPDSLYELVVRRLSGLSEDARTLLELAATFGRQVDAELLEGVGLLGEGRTLAAIETLLVAQVLEESRAGQYRFTHDLLREVAYEQIPHAQRRALHRLVALALEARYEGLEERSRYSATLAHHWYRSIGDRRIEAEGVDRAIEYLKRSTWQAVHAGQPAEAVEFGRAAARLLGVALPQAPEVIKKALKDKLARIRELLAGRKPGELRELPASTDPIADRSVELLVSILPPAFLSNQLDLFVLMACKNLATTLDKGLGPLAPSVFAFQALVERIVLDDARTAREYAALALELDRRTGGTQTADVLFLKTWFVDHWVVPIREILADCDLGAKAGLASGEVLYGCYNHGAHVFFLAASGEPLARVIEEADARLAIVGRRVLVARFHCVLERQLARALAGLTDSPTSLSDDQFDESHDLAFICRTTNANQKGFYHVARLKLHYYRGEYPDALLAAERARASAGSFARQPAEVDLVFFEALALLGEGSKNLEAARGHLASLTRWRTDSEANFAHKVLLVEAEIARVEGRDHDARRFQDEAIRSAEANGFPHHAALARELAARHLVAIGNDASEMLQAAIDGYRAWGAVTLADRLARIDGPKQPN
jgi:predicted ATPase/serine/threonine protein kinase